MKCPFCNYNEDKVVDSRETSEGLAIRRRRECLNCGRRYTTYESVEKMPLMVIKKDGRRETFNRQKILNGLLLACQKRPVSMEKLEDFVSEVESDIQKKFEQEVESRQIGEMVIDKLASLDDVAYVRFASVYRHFKDINQFMRELRDILSKRIK
ncbi:MAG: transcriptional repressor NrdR [Candidatus Omnitrophota bacterium]|nr:MAG: transcriptional repressor NrdR [Candidatus Omnitrophota bacterium]